MDLSRDEPGVYELGNELKTVVYVGSACKIKNRLDQHLSSDNPCIKSLAHYYPVDYRGDYEVQERRLYDEFVRANGCPPICNDRRP